MDKRLAEYGEFFKAMGLSELTVEDGAFKVSMKAANAASTPEFKPVINSEPAVEISAGLEVKSPILGTFKSCAEAVKVGDRVKAGDVLCNIEAMKMYNEVTSPYEGVIKEVRSSDGELVEFGQVLFVIGGED